MSSALYFAATLQWMGSFFILLLCLYRWRNLSSDLKAVGVYAGLSFFFQLLQVISMFVFSNRYNNLVANIYSPVELFSLLLIYYNTTRMARYKSVLKVLGLTLCVILTGVAALNPHTLNGTSETIRDITMIVCSFVYFLLIVKDMSEEHRTEESMFWVNASILFFFSSTLILSLSMDYIQTVLREDFVIFWILRNLLRAFFCVVICIGIWKAGKLSAESLAKRKVQ